MFRKKLTCAALAMSVALGCAVPVFAARDGELDLESMGMGFDVTDPGSMIDGSGAYAVCDGDGDAIRTIGASNGFHGRLEGNELLLEGVNPSQTIYIYLGPDSTHEELGEFFENDSGDTASFPIRTGDLANEDVMNLRVSVTGEGKDLVAGVSQVSGKRIGDFDRGSWLKLMLFDMADTEEKKADITLTFKTKQKGAKDTYDGTEDFEGGYASQFRIRLWINNTQVGGYDGDAEDGDRIFFTPESAGDNTFLWDNQLAALKFSADSDASDFYCRMSTNEDSQVYADYGDPVNADLYFFDFVTHPVIPSTSRATLTLGIPWDEDDDYQPDPAKCRIYQQDVMGKLTDVTDLFTYSEDDETIPGWSMRTRKLESYVISDVPLPVEETADDYSDVYFYSDEELDRIFAIDPATSLAIQTSYINSTVQQRLEEILKGGTGGSNAKDRVDNILKDGSTPPDHVDEILGERDATDASAEVDAILSRVQ